MNPEQEPGPEIEFDPDAALHQLRECDRCGLTVRCWFNLNRTLVTIGGMGHPCVFFAHRYQHGDGIGVSFVLRRHSYYIRVNLITKGHFWDAGTEVPDHLIPVWCIKKHRIGEREAFELREDRRLRREQLERERAAAERKSAAM